MEEAIVIAGFWNCSNGKIHSDLFKQWKVVSETEWFLNLLLGFKVPIKIKNWDVETYRNNLEDVFDRIKKYSLSVHFKTTVAQSSFLSKVFFIFAEIKPKSISFKNVAKFAIWQHFWKKWGLLNCLLKMNGLYLRQ